MIELIRANCKRLWAIGEVGLDYWKVQDNDERELQKEIFKRFIKLSLELNLPLNVHSRSAGRQTIETLLESNALKVIMHAFDGKASTAMPAVEAGYFFSIPPSIVRSRQKQKLVKRLPVESILFETDSPVLAPESNERNEPANLLIALNAVVEIKNLNTTEIKQAAIDNFNRCFIS